jgi:hypothetical protein
MTWIEPKNPRRPEIDYTICELPQEILAIVRMKYYVSGKADEVDQVVLYEDGQNGYEAFASAVNGALARGADVSIRSQYRPDQLGIVA